MITLECFAVLPFRCLAVFLGATHDTSAFESTSLKFAATIGVVCSSLLCESVSWRRATGLHSAVEILTWIQAFIPLQRAVTEM